MILKGLAARRGIAQCSRNPTPGRRRGLSQQPSPVALAALCGDAASRKKAASKATTTMGRWVSRWSSGRRMPARSRSCSTASSMPSTAIPGSSSRTASMSIESSASSPGGSGRFSPERSERSTRSSHISPRSGSASQNAGRIGARSLCCVRSSQRARLDALGPSSRFAGFADSLAGALTEIEAGLLDPEDLGPDLAALTESYRAELERLGVCDRGHGAAPGGRAADDRPRRLERRAGLRLRVRGPDRRRMAPRRGARGAR